MHRNRLQKLIEFFQNEPNDPFLKYALATEYLKSNEPDRALFYYEGAGHRSGAAGDDRVASRSTSPPAGAEHVTSGTPVA